MGLGAQGPCRRGAPAFEALRGSSSRSWRRRLLCVLSLAEADADIAWKTVFRREMNFCLVFCNSSGIVLL